MKSITNDEHCFGWWHQWCHLMKWQCFKLKHSSNVMCPNTSRSCSTYVWSTAELWHDQLQLWYAAKHMEYLHDILLNNHVQTVCVHAQCDFRNIDDGILQQVNDNHKQGNVSPGISSANEQRWLDYSMKIVTQSDCSDKMLFYRWNIIIVP